MPCIKSSYLNNRSQERKRADCTRTSNKNKRCMTFTSSHWLRSPLAHCPAYCLLKKAISGDTPQSVTFLLKLHYLTVGEYITLAQNADIYIWIYYKITINGSTNANLLSDYWKNIACFIVKGSVRFALKRWCWKRKCGQVMLIFWEWCHLVVKNMLGRDPIPMMSIMPEEK